MKISHIVMVFTTILLLVSTNQVNAHSGEKPIRFVSASGADDGVCNSPSFPCKTIAYAVNQSSKGDKIHVAAGEYHVKGLDVFFLLSDMIELKGGYSSNFKTYDKTNYQPTIVYK